MQTNLYTKESIGLLFAKTNNSTLFKRTTTNTQKQFFFFLFFFLIVNAALAAETTTTSFFNRKIDYLIEQLETVSTQLSFRAYATPITRTGTDCNKIIPESGASTHVISSVINIPESGTIEDINIKNLDITHSWINDLRITLIGPDNTSAIVINQICNDENNLLLNLDDEASVTSFSPCPPTDGGNYRPNNPLSIFDGKEINGNWTLRIEDTYPSEDGGTFNCWALEFETELTTCENVLTNGELDNGTTDWNLYTQPSNTAALSVDNSNQLSSTNSALVDISTVTGTDWHIQFVQTGKNIEAGKNYNISFQAKAAADRKASVMLQRSGTPYSVYWWREIDLSTTTNTYSFDFIADSTNTGNVGFYINLGESTENVWIDNLSYQEVCSPKTTCGTIQINNVTSSNCINHPLMDVATVDVEVSWSDAPFNDSIAVKIDNQTEFIAVNNGITSPHTIQFTIPADGSTNNNIQASWHKTTGCETMATYNAPTPCSSDEIGCDILYICGDDKLYDGDAWDHGWLEYLDAINGNKVLTPVFSKVDASGMGLYDPNNTNTALSINFNDYDLIIVSATTEGKLSNDIIDSLAITPVSVLNSNINIYNDLGMTVSEADVAWQTNAFTDNTTVESIYNFNNKINPWGSSVLLTGDYHANADVYLWEGAGDQAAGIEGVLFNYTSDDVLPSIPSHGNRVFLGYHMNGFYGNDVNGGTVPTPSSAWFEPAKHLTLVGKTYFDSALILASANCATTTTTTSCALTNPYPGFPIDFLNDNSGWVDYNLGNDLTLIDNGNGTKNILGTITNGTPVDFGAGMNGTSCGATDGWTMNLTLSDKMDWVTFQAAGGSANVHANCNAQIANLDYWDVSGTLVGTGCNAGRTLTINGPKAPYRLQIGTGGNSGDSACEFGMSTWFDMEENGTVINADIYAFLEEDCYTNINCTVVDIASLDGSLNAITDFNNANVTIGNAVITIAPTTFSGTATIDEYGINDNHETGSYGLQLGVNSTGSTNYLESIYNFSLPVENFNGRILDIDFSDAIRVYGKRNGVDVPFTVSNQGTCVNYDGSNTFNSTCFSNGDPTNSANYAFELTFNDAIDQIIFQSYDPGPNTGGSFTFVISPNISCSVPEEVCDNGIDDDGDGLIDCNDPDCETGCIAVGPANNSASPPDSTNFTFINYSQLGYLKYENIDVHLCANNNGSMSYKGTIAFELEYDGTETTCGSDDRWAIDLTLVHIGNGIAYTDTTAKFIENNACGASGNSPNWEYWAFDGIISGLGCNLGDTIFVDWEDYQHPIQLGQGANTKNCDFGLSTWISSPTNSGTTASIDLFASFDQSAYPPSVSEICTTPTFDKDVCYLIADGDGDGWMIPDTFYTFNHLTGTVTSVGLTGTMNIEAMALDTVNHIIYAADDDDFGVIDIATGTFTAINTDMGSLNGAEGTNNIADLDGMTYDYTNNIIWATERASGMDGLPDDLLLKIDPATGMPIADGFGAGIGYLTINTNENDLDDIAIATDGTLYAISNLGSSGNQRLGIINKTTGAWTEIGDYGIEDVESLTFTAKGQLLATTGEDGDHQNSLYSIDASTAEASFVGSILPAQDVEACACNFGNFIDLQIGDKVWADLDADGIQDIEEPGIKDVAVNLLNENGTPYLDVANNPVTTITDIYGIYNFGGLSPGNYIVEFELPTGTSFATKDVGGDDTKDSDADAVTGRTEIITLSGSNNNRDADAGILNANVVVRDCDDQGELFVIDELGGAILRFNSTTGALIDTFITGLSTPKEMIVGADNYLYVSDAGLDEVRRYSLITGALIDVLARNLKAPNGMTFDANGMLYINNKSNDEVLRIDPSDGTVTVFVTQQSGGLDSNNGGLAFGPDGNLYVPSRNTDEVLRFNGTTGAFIDAFVSAGSGTLNGPDDLAFGADGHLYVVSSYSDQVKRYNGTTGAFIDNFVTYRSGGIRAPKGLTFGTDGHIYVSGQTAPDGVYRYNELTGAFVDLFATGLADPRGMLFAPVPNCDNCCSQINYNNNSLENGNFSSFTSGANPHGTATLTTFGGSDAIDWDPSGGFGTNGSPITAFGANPGYWVDASTNGGAGSLDGNRFYWLEPRNSAGGSDCLGAISGADLLGTFCQGDTVEICGYVAAYDPNNINSGAVSTDFVFEIYSNNGNDPADFVTTPTGTSSINDNGGNNESFTLPLPASTSILDITGAPFTGANGQVADWRTLNWQSICFQVVLKEEQSNYSSVVFSMADGSDGMAIDNLSIRDISTPDAGKDTTIYTCSQTIDLNDALSGETWSKVIEPAGATAAIDATSGVITGLTENGEYKFLLTKTTDATCQDTIRVLVNCITEICNDNIDNDGDGLVDCADGDCYTSCNTCNLGALLSACIGPDCPLAAYAIDADGDCIEDTALSGYPGGLVCSTNNGLYRPQVVDYPTNLIRGRDAAFNTIIQGDLIITDGAEIEGKVAIGGNLVKNSGGYFGIGESGGGTYVIAPANEKALIIRGTTIGGSNSFGVGGTGVLMGGDYDAAQNTFPNWISVTENVGTTAAALGIDIDATHVDLYGKSQYWSSLATTGTGFVGDNTSPLQVFNISSFPANGSFTGIPDGATVLVNVSGTNPSIGRYVTTINTEVHNRASLFKIIWNFYEATTLNLPEFDGAVIAPLANVSLVGPSFDGRLYVGGNLEINSPGNEIHNYPFTGTLPCPTPITEICDNNIDDDGDGLVDEDDADCCEEVALQIPSFMPDFGLNGTGLEIFYNKTTHLLEFEMTLTGSSPSDPLFPTSSNSSNAHFYLVLTRGESPHPNFGALDNYPKFNISDTQIIGDAYYSSVAGNYSETFSGMQITSNGNSKTYTFSLNAATLLTGIGNSGGLIGGNYGIWLFAPDNYDDPNYTVFDVYGGVANCRIGEICGNNQDDDGDGLTDCEDPDCQTTTITNLSFSNCTLVDNEYQSTLSVEVEWSNPPAGENIIVSANNTTQTIDIVGGATSPVTVQFTITADNSQNNPIAIDYSGGSGCSFNTTYNAPAPCPDPTDRNTLCDNSSGHIGGIVFEDLNGDGLQDNGEPGIAGILVSATDSTGATVGQTTTNNIGVFQFEALTNGIKVRLEFTAIPSGMYPTNATTHKGTTVQFEQVPSCDAILGLIDPTENDCAAPNNAILQNGFALVSTLPAGDDLTLSIKDITQLGTLWQTAGNRNTNQAANVNTIQTWTTTDFEGASIFSTAINPKDGTIYAVASPLHASAANTETVLFETVIAPKVFKINAVTGAVTRIAELPGNLGLGYIEFDAVHEQLFVTNIDDGRIYRLNTDGTLLSSFDPLVADDGIISQLPALGDRILGIAFNPINKRIYYSTWSNHYDRTNVSTNVNATFNTIRSVALDANGAFIPATDQLEITMPYGSSGFNLTTPVGDIAFNRSGDRVLLAEFPLGENTSTNQIVTAAYIGVLREYQLSAGVWNLEPTYGGNDEGKYDIGSQTFYKGRNSRGGVDWGYESVTGTTINGDDSYILATGDALHITAIEGDNISGLQFTPATGGNITNSILVDLDNNLANENIYVYGDVDIYKDYCATLSLEIGNYVWVDEDEDGIQDANEYGMPGVNITLYSAAGDSLTTVVTDADGSYYFNDGTHGLMPSTTYYVVIGKGGQYDTTLGVLNQVNNLTVANTGTGNASDLNDSDGAIATTGNGQPVSIENYPFIEIQTGTLGQNDHSFDFGFRQICSAAIVANDSLVLCPGTAYEGSVAVNDNNYADKNFSVIVQPTSGSVNMNLDGTFAYTSTISNCSTDEFTYQVCDQTNICCVNAIVHLNFNDTTIPTLTNIPANDTVSCDELIPLPTQIFAIDNCPRIALDVQEESTQGEDGCSLYDYTITRTWTAIDQCGNSTSASQVIEVEDNVAPDIYRIYNLPNGKKMVAGVMELVGEHWKTINLPIDFSTKPIILHQVVTSDAAIPVVSQIQNISVSQFELKIKAEEAHIAKLSRKSVAWIAIETGVQTTDYQLDVNSLLVSEAAQGVNFQNAFTTTPALFTSSQTTDEEDPFSIRQDGLTTTDAMLNLQEEASNDVEVIHTAENIGYLAIEKLGSLREAKGILIGEVGTVTINSNWTTVNLNHTYHNPVIIANSLSNIDGEAATVSVRNVDLNTFEISVNEWAYLDGTHNNETVSYIVIEGSIPLESPGYCDNGTDSLDISVDFKSVDNCDVSVVINYVEKDTFIGATKIITRTWSAEDECGNATAYSQEISCEGVSLQIKSILQGAMLNNNKDGLMRDDLRRKNLLPMEEPYTTIDRFQHVAGGGGETINDANLLVDNGANSIVDWVFVELRAANDVDNVVATKSALIQKDGDVVTVRGDSLLHFTNTPIGDYYVAIRHRNHLGIISLDTYTFLPNAVPMVDFTFNFTPVLGDHSSVEMDNLESLWSGDLNNDGKVIYQGPNNDIFYMFLHVLRDEGNKDFLPNYISRGYTTDDFNLDGSVIYQGPSNDRSKLLFNTILSHPNNSNKFSNFIIYSGGN